MLLSPVTTRMMGNRHGREGVLFVFIRLSDNCGLLVFVLFVVFLFIIVIIGVSRRYGVAYEA
jgi:hypothetical protein